MAYTFDDFVAAATNAGLMNRFSEEDLRIAQSRPEYGLSALKLTQDLQGAKTMEQRLLAQEAMTQLRKTYGATGTQTSEPTGQTVYQQALNQAAGEMPAAGSFRYDPAADPAYEAMKKSYLREGDRARADTLAEVSAATGGVPSSFAVTAAGQAGDYYRTQFADQVPALEQTAYQRYLNELEIKKEAADLMAKKGDYSLLADYLGLTAEQKALLEGKKKGTPQTVYQPTEPNEELPTEGTPVAGLSDADFNRMKAGLIAAIQYAPKSAVESSLDTWANSLNEAQMAEVLALLQQNGY